MRRVFASKYHLSLWGKKAGPCRVSPLIFIEFLLKLGKKLLNKWLALTMLRACKWPLVGTLRWRDIL